MDVGQRKMREEVQLIDSKLVLLEPEERQQSSEIWKASEGLLSG